MSQLQLSRAMFHPQVPLKKKSQWQLSSVFAQDIADGFPVTNKRVS